MFFYFIFNRPKNREVVSIRIRSTIIGKREHKSVKLQLMVDNKTGRNYLA